MIGKQLSHFKILSKLGEGGMGVVYRARDENLGREVALKVLPPESMASEERRLRFLREARTAAAVTHRHIATIHEVDEADGVVFIAMELVEGDTLTDRIGGKALSMRDGLRIAIEIAEALAAAHGGGVIHRDLKPDNVIVGPDGHAKILDFGLAKPQEDAGASSREAADSQTISADMTREGRVMGTVAYMSPEQARGLQVDSRSDLFSFGIVLYEMVTGTKPFFGTTATDTLTSILRDAPAPPVQANAEIAPELERIIHKCLEKSPDDRYQHADEIVVDLRRLRRQTDSQPVQTVSGVTAVRPVASRPWWKNPLPLAAAALVLVAAAVGVWQLVGGRSSALAPAAGVDSLAVLPLENLKDRGDPDRLGRILQELIITDLSGVESLKVFSSQRLLDIRKQIGGDRGAVIDPEVATEVARKAGAQTMLTGSLSQLGAQWILACQLVNVADGSVIKSERIDGADLYSMVDRLTEQIRTDLGLMGETAEKVSVGDKTTSSLEAFKHYLAGVEFLNDRKFEEAVGELGKAVEIDPAFGQAQYQLGIAAWWYGGDEAWHLPEGQQSGEEILENLLSGDVKLTARERRLAEAFLPLVRREYQGALPLFEQLVENYPDEKEAWYGLGEARYHVPGGSASLEAIEPFQKALELDPSFRLAYAHIDDVYSRLNKIDEGLATTRRLLDANPDDLSWYREWIGWLVRTGDRSRLDAGVTEAVERTKDPAARRELLVTLGNDLFEIEAYDDAERYLRQALEFYVDGDDSGILNLLGWVLHERQRNREAERRFREALEIKPLLGPSLSGLLEILTEERRFDEALTFFGAKVAEHPNQLSLYDYWIRSAVLAGDERGLERAIGQGLEKCSTNRQRAHFWLRVSWAYASAENPAQRFSAVKKAAAALEGESDALVESTLAWGYYWMRDLETSEGQFAKVLEIDPTNGSSLNGLAQLSVERGEHDKAIAYVQRLIDVLPAEPEARGLMVVVQSAAGNPEAAGRYLGEGLGLARTNEQRRSLLTTATFGFLFGNEVDRAVETGEKAVALDPGKNHTGPRLALAVARLRQRRFDDAERLVSDIVRTHPNDHDALNLQGTILMARGDLEGAEGRFRELLELRPATVSDFANMAIVLGELGRYGEAVPHARKALEMEPSRSNHALLSCSLIAGKIDVDEGIRVARRGLGVTASLNDMMTKAIPAIPPIEECVGLGHLARGKYREAVAQFEKAAEKAPDRASIRAYLEEAGSRR